MARFSCSKLTGFGLLFVGVFLLVDCIDLDYTDITIVTDETRWQVQNPDVSLDSFDKIRHVKGNIYFSKGKRITGDKLLLNFDDTETFTQPEDIEVFIRYPAIGNGATITFAEVLVDLTSDDAETSFVGGGISQTYAEFLIECNNTLSFTYEIFIYGY